MNLKEKRIMLDILWQECGMEKAQFNGVEYYNVIDTKCLSCYEEACFLLTQEGVLKGINGRLYYIWNEEDCLNHDPEMPQ